MKNNFKKKFKQMKKQLIKHAKEFQAFDYGFMETILFDCIKIYYWYLQLYHLYYHHRQNKGKEARPQRKSGLAFYIINCHVYNKCS